MKFFSAHEHWGNPSKKPIKDSHFTLLQGFVLAQPLIYSFIAWLFISPVEVITGPIEPSGITPPIIGFMLGLISIIFYIMITSTLFHQSYYSATKVIPSGLLLFIGVLAGIEIYFNSLWM